MKLVIDMDSREDMRKAVQLLQQLLNEAPAYTEAPMADMFGAMQAPDNLEQPEEPKQEKEEDFSLHSLETY